MTSVDRPAIRVLVVDDALEVRRDLRTALTLAGNIEVVGEAANGLEAVRLAESLEPAVVLMDLEMPVLDGYAATRQIKAHRPACRVIALTVHSYESARRKAIESGVDDFVIKGVSLESLVRAISGARTTVANNSFNTKDTTPESGGEEESKKWTGDEERRP